MPDNMVTLDGWMNLVDGGIDRLKKRGFEPGADGELIIGSDDAGYGDSSGTGLFYNKKANVLSDTPESGEELEEPILTPALRTLMQVGETEGAFESGMLLRYIIEDPFRLEVWHKRPGKPLTRHVSTPAEL